MSVQFLTVFTAHVPRSDTWAIAHRYAVEFLEGELRINGTEVFRYSDHDDRIIQFSVRSGQHVFDRDDLAHFISHAFDCGLTHQLYRESRRRRNRPPAGPLATFLRTWVESQKAEFGGCRLGGPNCLTPSHARFKCEVCGARHHVKWANDQWTCFVTNEHRVRLEPGSCDSLARQIHQLKEKAA